MFPLLDNTAGNSYGLFPEQSILPWNDAPGYNVNSSFLIKSQFVNAAKGSQICYPVFAYQNDFNSARPLWSFYQDPDNQGFYGTCYIKARPVTFLPYPSVPVDPMNQYRFSSKCIPCDNIGQDLTNPRWGPQLNYCTDCEKYPAPARQAPTIPAWTWKANGTFVDPIKWLSPAGTPLAMADECALLASRDSTCSKFVMFSNSRYLYYSGQNVTMQTSITVTNGSMTYRLVNNTLTYNAVRYTPYALTTSYFRTCGCLLASANVNASLPTIDVNGTANACDGITVLTQCVQRGFQVYQLA